jgi:L-threonylcarbamoyladenylate synthase
MIIPEGEAACAKAAEIVRRGNVIGYRTDTLYGLGVDPLNAVAVSKVIDLKGREDGKPILLLISDPEVIPKFLTQTSTAFHELSERFWPGPLTLIGEARGELPRELTAGTGTLGLRLPDSKTLRDLVSACGGALTATSANPSGKPAALSAPEVESYFPQIDLIVDGGCVTATEASTVLEVLGSRPRLIREGRIKRMELARWLDG